MIARRIVLWAVPGALLAALAWSLLAPRTPPGTHEAASPRTQEQRTQEQPGEAPRSVNATPPVRSDSQRAAAVTPYGEIRLGDLVGSDDSGRKRWRIVADQVTLSQGGQVVLLRGVHATFYAPNGTTMTVAGESGKFNTKTRDVDLLGSVHGVSSVGRELFADRLHYSPAADEVTGTGHVRLIEERVIIYADRMVSKPTLDQTRFYGHVHIAVR